MTRPIKVPLTTPKRINAAQFARNGMAPSAKLDSLLATQINHLVRNRRKLLFTHGLQVESVPAGATGTTERARFYFMTGLGAEYVKVNAMVMARIASASTVPQLKLDLKDIGAGTTVTVYINVPPLAIASPGIEGIYSVAGKIPCDEKKVYELTVSDVYYTRMMSICGYDAATPPSDEDTHYLPAVTSFGKPILASRHNQMRDIINDLYKYNGPQLISWAGHGGVDSVQTSGASLVRAFPTMADFRIDLSNMARRTKTTVPVVFGAYGDVGGGTPQMNVHLYTGGVSKGSVSVTADNTWVTTTINLDASDLAYDIRIQRITGTTHTLKGVTCYVYDP